VDRNRLLGAVSAAQLTTAMAGLAVALKRRHPYDDAIETPLVAIAISLSGAMAVLGLIGS
jgi:hypothetical protein